MRSQEIMKTITNNQHVNEPSKENNWRIGRLALLIFSFSHFLLFSASAQQLPYQDTSLSAEQRADDLLKRLTVEEKAKLMMNGSPAIERLDIPQFEWWNEALHGVGRNGYVTVFPITTQMAASFDDRSQRNKMEHRPSVHVCRYPESDVVL